MLLVVCTWAVLFVPDALDRLRSDVVAALLYVTNWWYIVDGQSYFEALGRPPLLQHLWSLAVEEQWYLIWPLVFVFAMRRAGGRRSTAWWCRCWRWRRPRRCGWRSCSTPPATSIACYYGTDTHMSGLLIGAAAAMCWRPWRSRAAGQRHLLLVDLAGAAALAALIVIMLSWGSDTLFLYQGGFVVVALLAIVVVAAAVHPGARLLAGLLSLAPLRWIGHEVLRHLPVALARHRDLRCTRPGLAPPVGAPLWTVLTLGLAELSYRFVESPVRRGALTRWYHRLRTVEGPERSVLWSRAQVAGLAVVFVIGGLGVRLANAEKVDVALGGAEQQLSLTPATSAPGTPGPAAVAVATTLAPLPRRVAVVGDSQANALVKNAPSGLGQYLRLSNGAVEGCGLIDSGSIVTRARFRRDFDNCDGLGEVLGPLGRRQRRHARRDRGVGRVRRQPQRRTRRLRLSPGRQLPQRPTRSRHRRHHRPPAAKRRCSRCRATATSTAEVSWRSPSAATTNAPPTSTTSCVRRRRPTRSTSCSSRAPPSGAATPPSPPTSATAGTASTTTDPVPSSCSTRSRRSCCEPV